MYEIQLRSGNQWAVVDGDQGRTMYVGPLYQCEDWLDSRENELVTQAGSEMLWPDPRTRAPSALPWAGVLGQKLYALLRHPFTKGVAVARETAQPTE
ncbi:MAG TPA: hypothetical protein VMP01_28685 [Pirellulaceae bacterium]|nr:hypothetical protein [Pirellulaceae bacterium]